MRHPDGACQECGERLYGTADGGTFCPNCGDHSEESEGVPGDGEAASDGVAESSGDSDGGDAVAESS